MARPINVIAKDIQAAWPNVNPCAEPYLQGMLSPRSVTLEDRYGYDDVKTLVLYFLSNASSFRGEQARKLKAELKQILADSGYKF
jgi:hypothetical protein